MIRWVEAGDKEGWIDGRVWRYYPLDNLYALTLGFACGAALATLVIIRQEKYRLIGALSMPILSVVLTLGILLGDQITTLQPILDSYWRPIHVSIATIGYGVCLVSFGLAFAFLLKDGLRSDALAVAVLCYGVVLYMMCGTVGGSGLWTTAPIAFNFNYGASLMLGSISYPIRVELPWVGALMAFVFALIVVAVALFIIEWKKEESRIRVWAWRLFGAAAVAQGVVLILFYYQVSHVSVQVDKIPESEFQTFGPWLAEQFAKSGTPLDVGPDRYAEVAHSWVNQNAAGFTLSLKGNPVEFGGLLGLFVALLVVWLIIKRRKLVESSLPAVETLDSLLYKTVGVAFPLLTLLLITGAVWANESWGRYWGWDAKEVGALTSWFAYAGYLHTRIAHGWRGRRSAYFALLGFVLVVFTWLGVSYLLKGLHSYA
jgi:cytochrome c-type biogenesis protein CcsB